MKLSPIVLKIRTANTRFSNRVAGAAEMELALAHTLKQDTAFVIQLSESTPLNAYDGTINQKITETFAVVVGLLGSAFDWPVINAAPTAAEAIFFIKARLFVLSLFSFIVLPSPDFQRFSNKALSGSLVCPSAETRMALWPLKGHSCSHIPQPIHFSIST